MFRGSVISPTMADATAVSGLTRYTISPRVPERSEKFRLKVRRLTVSLAGESPWPMHGPQADSRILAPALNSGVKHPVSASIISTCRLPGAIASSTIGAIRLARRRTSATIVRSARLEFVQLPIRT
jgi:hypothetical protein